MAIFIQCYPLKKVACKSQNCPEFRSTNCSLGQAATALTRSSCSIDSANATQLGGFSLSDDPAKPRKFVFPENTSIESDSFLVIKSTNEGGMDFRLDKNGEGLWFYDAEGQLIDSVMFGNRSKVIHWTFWPRWKMDADASNVRKGKPDSTSWSISRYSTCRLVYQSAGR